MRHLTMIHFCRYCFLCVAGLLFVKGPLLLSAEQVHYATHYGDINDDGNVNISDAVKLVLIIRKAVEPTFKEQVLSDTDADGMVTYDDLWYMLNYFIGRKTLRTIRSFDGNIIRDHPRLILCGDLLSKVRETIKTSRKDVYERMQNQVESYIGMTSVPDNIVSREIGRIAERLALIHLLADRQDVVPSGVVFLEAALDELISRTVKNNAGHWLVVSLRRSTAFAYDWLFQAMTEEERVRLGGKILEAASAYTDDLAWYSPYRGGGYSNFEPFFLAGITLVASGVDDQQAGEWYRWAGREIVNWHEVHAQVAADDGGVNSGMDYANTYLRTQLLDYWIWRGATGDDLLAEQNMLKYFSQWWTYCLRPNEELTKLGDVVHVKKNITQWHLKALATTYKDPLSLWWLEKRTPVSTPSVWDVIWDTSDLDIVSEGPAGSWPLGRHFEGIGWVAMRSGWDADASLAVFKCGDFYYGHEHADQNSFTIFKKGSLAIDSGRYEWESDHRSNYAARTIAHNTILVYDPAETFDGGTIANDGGQIWPTAHRRSVQEADGTQWDKGDITAFETNQYFSYVCGDASNAYNKSKLESFTRQFIHIQPDLFIVYDRVKATNPDFQKFWLLHSMNEPVINGSISEIRERDGKLFCKTILPDSAQITKVGGEGAAFEVFGTDYPPSVSYFKLQDGEEWGGWRIEVSPSDKSSEHLFLNVLQAGDDSLGEMIGVQRISDQAGQGVSFSYQSLEYLITFADSAAPGGHVKIQSSAGDVLYDDDLADLVQPQTSMGN